MEQRRLDPEWIKLQAQHELQRDQWHMELQTLQMKYETIGKQLEYHESIEKAKLMAKLNEEDSEFWRRQYGKTPTMPVLTTSKPLLATVRPSTDPTWAQEPVRALGNADVGGTPNMTGSEAQQRAEEPLRRSYSFQQQQEIRMPKASVGDVQPCKPEECKTKTTTASRSKPTPQSETVVIDLCSSDDEILVEVPRAMYEKKYVRAPDRAPRVGATNTPKSFVGFLPHFCWLLSLIRVGGLGASGC